MNVCMCVCMAVAGSLRGEADGCVIVYKYSTRLGIADFS